MRLPLRRRLYLGILGAVESILFTEEGDTWLSIIISQSNYQIKLAAAVVTAALVQAPLRFAAYALMLRRSRRAYPQLFDGHAAAAAVAACLDEYQRELAA